MDEFDSSKHSGVISHFNQLHVKEGHFPKEAFKIIKTTSEMREHEDYEDFFIASRHYAEEQIHNAKNFLVFIKDYLEEKQILTKQQTIQNHLECIK